MHRYRFYVIDTHLQITKSIYSFILWYFWISRQLYAKMPGMRINELI